MTTHDLSKATAAVIEYLESVGHHTSQATRDGAHAAAAKAIAAEPAGLLVEVPDPIRDAVTAFARLALRFGASAHDTSLAAGLVLHRVAVALTPAAPANPHTVWHANKDWAKDATSAIVNLINARVWDKDGEPFPRDQMEAVAKSLCDFCNH